MQLVKIGSQTNYFAIMATEYTPKILIIDDLEVNLVTLEGNMRKLKVEIFKAQSGHEALLRIKQHDFALIIIDIQMPGMNGYEVAEQIRQGRRNQFTPIIFLTAVYFDQLSVYKGYQTGAVDYITKPFNFEILISKVKVFLDLDRIKHELSESRRQFMDVVQDQTDMICRTDNNLIINFVNNSFSNTIGIDAESIPDQSIFQWIPEEESIRLGEILNKLSPSGPMVEIQHQMLISENHKLSASSLVRALFSDDYELKGYQWVIRDITHEVTSKEQLMMAKQKAEDATRSKSRFLANMSHEARNPLNSILGMIEILQESELPAQLKENVSVMQYSANKLHKLLNDMLDLSRIEANQIKIEVNTFNLHDELKSLVKSYETVAGQKENRIKLTIDPQVPQQIKSDPLRLGQIISNLLNNSIRFTEKGTIEVIVSKADTNQNMVRLEFEVRDSGLGITSDTGAISFDQLPSGSQEITRTYGGSGLGLSISQSLCELMGGSLTFKSNPEDGNIFTFTLDVEYFDNATDENFKELFFLVVDDNLLNLKVVGSILTKKGISFDVAENGIIAFEKASMRPHDVILMDIQMPEMDGYDATRLIRMREMENNVDKKSIIIALTANATAEDKKKCMELGMNGYLTKPFSFSDLEPILLKQNFS